MSVTSKNTIDMSGEFSTFVFIDRVGDIDIGAMDLDLILMDIESTLVAAIL
jgi:hypothetical protein